MTDDILTKAAPHMAMCGACDAGLAMNCTCPTDSRAVVADLCREVERLRGDAAAIEARVRAELAAEIRAYGDKLMRDETPVEVVSFVDDCAKIAAGSSRDTTPGDDLTWADVRVPEGPRWVVPDTTPETERERSQ